MKKFDRLPPRQRRQEIQSAALELFNLKGFAATTMENIVDKVSLSKGGVYRLYPSTSAILSDLMLSGMHLRNAFYEEKVRQEVSSGRALSKEFLVGMIVDSLLLYPELSTVYVEFLWEKQRNSALEELYERLCAETVAETEALIRRYGAEELLISSGLSLRLLEELMNSAVLSLRVLKLQDFFSHSRDRICSAICELL